MAIPFVKMHGAANDFVVIDHREAVLPESPEARRTLIERLCDRRRGIGADGVLLLERDPELDFAMRYYNADGGAADYCGNGARCLARFALDHGLGRDGRVRFRTDVGVQEAERRPDGSIAVRFGRVESPGRPQRLDIPGARVEGRLVRAGVPHFVIPVDAVERAPLASWGPALRAHEAFGREGANVDLVARLGPNRVAMRTWERGVEGETLACGSGAIACALWLSVEGASGPIRVRTAGGDELEVSFRGIEGAYEATLAGPAEVAFTGSWPVETHAGAGRR